MKKLTKQTGILDLVQSFQIDPDAAMAKIYRLYRDEYLAFSKSISEKEDLRVDSFQEAVIGLYENLSRDKIQTGSSTVKTYLFSIGKNKLLNAIQKEKKYTELQSIKEKEHTLENNLEEVNGFLTKAVDQLGQRCQDVLIKFYYYRYSIEAIMHDMQYKNENTVKAHKSRCLSQLRDIIKK